MNTYQEAKTLIDLRASQGRDRAKLHKNIYLEPRPDGKIAVKYHDTDIVVYHPNGKIELHTGGWRTASTKANLNQYSPFQVWQSKGIWYIHTGGPFTDETTREFEDGMILDSPQWEDTAAA